MRYLLIATLLVLSAWPASAATLAPHRAVYDLNLLRASQGAALASVEGRLAFEILGSSCEGWTTSFRLANRYGPTEGETRIIDTQSTSYESGDFLDLRYQQKEFINGSAQPETRIKVSRTSMGAEGEGDQGEDRDRFMVPANALFPIQHQIKLMDLAAAGQSRDSSVIYDGSDGEKTFRVISFIGKRRNWEDNPRDSANPAASGLAGLASWPVSISYFPGTDTGSDTPEYQVSFNLFENGVATGLVLDYGEFALRGTLTNLETFKGDSCN
ncbi:MAG: DUF1849 family protein [Alphaproteobacteria bacterium]|nr:DUF1849 family protein [Alphaproteobacteria bacterium]